MGVFIYLLLCLKSTTDCTIALVALLANTFLLDFIIVCILRTGKAMFENPSCIYYALTCFDQRIHF